MIPHHLICTAFPPHCFYFFLGIDTYLSLYIYTRVLHKKEKKKLVDADI